MAGEQAWRGLWRRESEGAQCWWSRFSDLPNRGGEDGCIAWVEGWPGWPEALAAVCPKTQGPLCSVPTVRHSLQDVAGQERQAVAADLRARSGAAILAAAEHALERFAERWESP
jgi:transposase-like protein